MVDYVGAQVKINSLQPALYAVLCFNFISTVTFTFDLQDQGHVLFPTVDYVEYKVSK